MVQVLAPSARDSDAQQCQDHADMVLQERAKLEEFIYLVSHDVRACLRALCEVPQWIREDLESDGYDLGVSVGQSLDLLETNTARLDQMMRDLLEYSRVGRMQSSATSSISVQLKKAMQQMGDEHHNKIDMSLGVDRFPIGTEDLHRALCALLGNALKHHDRNHRETLVMSKCEGERVILRVSDDGPGIEAKYRERVLQPMTTLRPRDEVEGSGMGLAIANKVAGHYGGKLEFREGLNGRGLGVELSFPTAE